jgi:hypothetical protein
MGMTLLGKMSAGMDQTLDKLSEHAKTMEKVVKGHGGAK